jgi:uncharacterized protein (DUF302 family)
MRPILLLCFAVAVVLAVGARAAPALEPNDFVDPQTVVIATPHEFAALKVRLEAAVAENGFFVVSQASASAGAAGRGVAIPGNLVVGVFRNDYAVRMLDASVAAGIEAPLRFYVTEKADGTATLSYRKPSRVFAPYGVPELTAMAGELDPIWAKIARDATAP